MLRFNFIATVLETDPTYRLPMDDSAVKGMIQGLVEWYHVVEPEVILILTAETDYEN